LYAYATMRRSLLTQRLAHVLLVFVFTCLGSLPQLALCTGATGHRALELRGATCCRPMQMAVAAGGIRALRFGCALDCSDTPLGTVAAVQRSEQFAGTVSGTSVQLPLPGMLPPDAGRGQPAAASPPWACSLRVLRGTVALC
jgi:hypothetical protein